jgi:serine/threonine protein kinase
VHWDVFISHASEDNETVARPLAAHLREAGLRVWLDEHELLLGDSLRREIDRGLAQSRWGVVILSRHFLDKEWPQVYGFEQVGVAHGDLKPSNILVRDTDGTPALVDFMIPDLQRLLAIPEPAERSADHPTALFGTPGYMSPEQEIDGVVTPLSDVYALGRTFEQLFWGKPVDFVIATQAARGQVSPLMRLVESMVSPRPQDRPQSAERVLARLKELE